MKEPRPAMPTSDVLGESVRGARKARGWSQTELAHRAGVSRPTIARIEAGQGFSATTLQKVARALDLQITLVEPQQLR